MSLFMRDEEEVVLCSPMEGVITVEGKPVSNAKIERNIKWQDDVGETDTYYTDKNGSFSLPIKQTTVRLNKITQFVMSQEITVFYNNSKYMIWTLGKGSKLLYGELNGKPENFRCELTNDPIRVEVEDGLLGTSCVWDSIIK